MTRIFRRGELKAALLHVLAGTGPANGYAIMQRLNERVGANWQASPGAVYPALLALEDTGHITGHDDDGSRVYRLTDSGRRASDERVGLLDDVACRASSQERPTTLGETLDVFASQTGNRSMTLDSTEERAVRAILTTAGRGIASVLEQGATHE